MIELKQLFHCLNLSEYFRLQHLKVSMYSNSVLMNLIFSRMRLEIFWETTNFIQDRSACNTIFRFFSRFVRSHYKFIPKATFFDFEFSVGVLRFMSLALSIFHSRYITSCQKYIKKDYNEVKHLLFKYFDACARL